MDRRTAVTVALATILVVGLILIADPGEVADAIQGADYTILLAVVLLYVINLLFKSGRWYMLLAAADHKVSLKDCLTYFSVGQAFNNLIPGRVVGEATRVYNLYEVNDVPVGTSLATIVTERVMDLVLLTVIAVSGLVLLAPLLVDEIMNELISGVIVAVVVNGIIIYFLARPDVVERIGQRAANWIGRKVSARWGQKLSTWLEKMCHSFRDAMRLSKGSQRWHMFGAISFTVLIWVNEVGRLFLIMVALGTDVSIFAVMIATSLSTLSSVFLPAGSGNVVMTTAIFQSVGIPLSEATTAGVLSALTSIWLSIPIGVIAMLLTGLRVHKESEIKEGA